MNICVVGTGYVGLVVGTCLADFGMNVTCIDKDKDKIDRLSRGEVPIYEIGLQEIISRNLKLERLHFSADLDEAIDRSLVIYIAVGTPEKENGTADLSQVFEVAGCICKRMAEYKVIVIKSTVPVGTAQKLRQFILDGRENNVEFDIISNPEFLREGSAVDDFLHPDRVVLGGDSERAMAIIRDVYRPLHLIDTPIINCTNETAELSKYAANTMLALKVSYVNEIANLCERIGADVTQVAASVGLDKRIGPHFLSPGPGFGGSCLPKDVKAIVDVAEQLDYDFKLAKAAIDVNRHQQEIVVEKSRRLLGSFEDMTVCLLGLSFKPNTDDTREAPALNIARQILAEGGIINAYDPVANEEAARVLREVHFFEDAYAACSGADLVIVTTDWNEFKHLDFARVKQSVRQANFYDTRNIYNPKSLREAGFTYLGTGRP
jgi:UDPglucose 6-dehydrogenase